MAFERNFLLFTHEVTWRLRKHFVGMAISRDKKRPSDYQGFARSSLVDSSSAAANDRPRPKQRKKQTRNFSRKILSQQTRAS